MKRELILIHKELLATIPMGDYRRAQLWPAKTLADRQRILLKLLF
jgi:hypothetical protein